MFEKETEEYAKQFMKTHSESDEYINCKRETDNYNVLLAQGYELGFQKGAEFAYNKANEWHYVKDELPKTSGRYLVYTGGEPFILDFDTEVDSFGYWVVSLGDDWGVRDEDFETVKDRGEDDVITWKEIVPPSEPMRSLDKEEQKNYTEAINKVYKPTGVKLFDKENE